ncbi:MAG: FecR domain-containing protein [Thermoanaerobaculales bacterium]|nr:FecR domain-containing protein [Thermoanaerobaculales bacterium]
MKRLTASIVLTLLTLAAATASEAPAVLEYDVIAVKRKLLLETADGEREMQVGDHARSGDVLRTGSRSRAELAVIEYSAKFVVSSKTSFRLAHDRPGVLLEIERGSLRAVFGKLTEGDTRERLISTPSAVLAVRGTDYGVEVEKDGDTSVTVFEGTVEVWDVGGIGEKQFVPAGQATRIKRGKAPSTPKPHGITSHDWEQGRRGGNQSLGGSQQSPGMGAGGQSRGAGSQSSSSQGGSKRHGG